MRVSCASVAEFIENLEATDPKDVFGRVVYWSVNRQPVDGDKRTASSGKDAVIIFRFDNLDEAVRMLTENGVTVINGSKVYTM